MEKKITVSEANINSDDDKKWVKINDKDLMKYLESAKNPNKVLVARNRDAITSNYDYITTQTANTSLLTDFRLLQLKNLNHVYIQCLNTCDDSDLVEFIAKYRKFHENINELIQSAINIRKAKAKMKSRGDNPGKEIEPTTIEEAIELYRSGFNFKKLMSSLESAGLIKIHANKYYVTKKWKNHQYYKAFLKFLYKEKAMKQNHKGHTIVNMLNNTFSLKPPIPLSSDSDFNSEKVFNVNEKYCKIFIFNE